MAAFLQIQQNLDVLSNNVVIVINATLVTISIRLHSFIITLF